MMPINPTLIDDFHRDGYVMLPEAITTDQLNRLTAILDGWVEESRAHNAPYGETIDKRPRFDIQPDTHSPETPALRRVASPVEISEDYWDVAKNNAALDLTAAIFSPNIKFYASKINLKLPGSKTQVKYHQDFPFDPHTNMDMMTVLIFLDDVTLENGPLQLVPGSHKGPLYSLWQDGRFTGAVAKDVEKTAKDISVPCVGRAGDACLMHSCVLHGSSANLTQDPRRLFILTYVAEDAQAVTANPIPNIYDGEVVRGNATGRVRAIPYEMELPEYPKTASFFGQQEGQSVMA
ncbi:MAG: phytanoyl-CoA dioxygenase family protein [Alphaproteobacteria bacterium]|nr:phytanoyl-CoA dioxygenase family protein [Alphaproteobacteria bacterium]